MSPPDLNAAWSRALLQELFHAGARDAVVCPGSRSSPLAVGAAELPGLRVHPVVDERSAAFFALGLSRVSRRPTIVIATSGSAGAHFLPAAVEATLSHIPLVLLTADRPWELHDFGAPQTMPQHGLFGRFAHRAVELPVPEASDAAFIHLRAATSRAAWEARAGVLHVNVPFREPLAPTGGPPPPLSDRALNGRVDRPFLEFGALEADEASQRTSIKDVAERLRQSERPVIVCGPHPPDEAFAAAIAALALSRTCPVFVEAASNVRFGMPAEARGQLVTHCEALLAHEPFARGMRPDLVLKLGGGLTSKRLQQWIDGSGADVVVFADAPGQVVDPSHVASHVVPGPAKGALAALAGLFASTSGLDAQAHPARARWSAGVLEAERRARVALGEAFEGDAGPCLSEPLIARELAAQLPSGAPLFVSSSMPIRDLDYFASAERGPLHVHANRGANGIDGIVSTAAGVALASGRPAALLTGDLAFLHDVGGLLTARARKASLAIVVVNNDGGGIFSFLPIAKATPHFEALFGTPHGLDLRHAAALAEARHHVPSNVAEFRAALAEAMEGGLHVVEAKVPPREENPGLHRALWDRVAASLGEGPWS